MHWILKVSFLCSLLVTSLTYGQDTLLHEDFQSGGLSDFISLDMDGLNLATDFDGVAGGFDVLPISGPTDYKAIAVSAFDPPGAADNWLISPAIQIQSSGSILSWEGTSLSGDPAQLESYDVLLSRTGTAMTDFTDILYIVTEESSAGQHHIFDLSGYAGQTVHIAFRHTSSNKYALLIDDILITEPSSALSAELIELGDKKYQDLASRSLYLKVKNTGSAIITSLEVEGNINEGTGNFIFDDLNLLPGDDYFLVFSDLFPFVVDRYQIGARIISINGESYTSDFISEVFHLTDGTGARNHLVEVATSMTCGWCPGTEVDVLREMDIRSDLIPLLVHSDDPLVAPVYLFGFSSQDQYAGLPSVSINRAEAGQSEDLGEMLSEAALQGVPLSLGFAYNYDPVARSLNPTIEINAHTTLYPEDISLSMVIVEDSIVGGDESYDQSNNYSFENLDVPLIGTDGRDWQVLSDPVPYDQMSYESVVRDVVGGYEGIVGSVTDTVRNGETISASFPYVLPSVFDENQVSMVIMAIDNHTGEVMQVEKIPLEFMSSLDDTAIRSSLIYPNPAQCEVYLECEHQLSTYEIHDIAGQRVEFGNLQKYGGTLYGISSLELRTGPYILSVSEGNKVRIQKLLFIAKE